MDPFTMAEMLLGKLDMASGQLAQLRALNTRYFTELAALERTRGGGTTADIAALHASIAADIRDMLREREREVLDRNLPDVLSAAARGRW